MRKRRCWKGVGRHDQAVSLLVKRGPRRSPHGSQAVSKLEPTGLTDLKLSHPRLHITEFGLTFDESDAHLG